MEIITYFGDFFVNSGAEKLALFLTILGFFCIVYFYAKQKLSKEEVPDNTVLQSLVEENTRVVKELVRMIDSSIQSNNRVLSKLSSHDQRSSEILNTLIVVQNSLITINNKHATTDSVTRLHERLDEIVKLMVTKKDLSECKEKVDEIAREVNRICVKVGC